jgi:hypothetical protein
MRVQERQFARQSDVLLHDSLHIPRRVLDHLHLLLLSQHLDPDRLHEALRSLDMACQRRRHLICPRSES